MNEQTTHTESKSTISRTAKALTLSFNTVGLNNFKPDITNIEVFAFPHSK